MNNNQRISEPENAMNFGTPKFAHSLILTSLIAIIGFVFPAPSRTELPQLDKTGRAFLGAQPAQSVQNTAGAPMHESLARLFSLCVFASLREDNLT